MSIYEEYWDRYVRKLHPGGKDADQWPGDEWGTPNDWKQVFQTLFEPAGAASWKNTVEIGSGAGKYTDLVLRAGDDTSVLACDVSSAFLETLGKRLAADQEAGRLETHHLRGEDPRELYAAIESRRLVRNLDAFYSIDAMVHVDLQYLATYMLTAGLTLRPGGRLLLTVANGTSEAGIQHLMAGIPHYYSAQGRPCAKFEYVDGPIMTAVLEYMGFEIEHLETLPAGRDLAVSARLANPSRAEALRWTLTGNCEQMLTVGSEAPTPVLSWDGTGRGTTTIEASHTGPEGPVDVRFPTGSPWFRLPADVWSGLAPGASIYWRVVDPSEEYGAPPVASGKLTKAPLDDSTQA